MSSGAGTTPCSRCREDAFVEVVTQGQSVAPLYFAYTADTNRRLRDLLDDAEPPPRFGIDDLERCRRARTRW